MTLAIAGNASSGYNITKSLRLRQSASAYLSRTPGTASNRKTWTWSAWVKRGAFSNGLFQGYIDGSNQTSLGFGGANFWTLFVQDIGTSGGGYNLVWETSAVFRDPAAWYHIVLAYDTTQASNLNAVKIYVNGVQQTLTYATYQGAYVQNRDSFVNATNSQIMGRYNNGSLIYLDAYFAEVNFIDGQALTASSFGSFNTTTGVWQPARYTGTYGTNGFYLPFTNTTSTTTLGYDFSGNSNNWTTNNISLTAGVNYDSMNDVPTLTSPTQANYPTFNAIRPGSYGGTLALSNGNLKATTVQANSDNDISSTMELPGTGKWYWEVTITGGAAAPAGGTGYNLNIVGTNLSGGVGWASKTGSPFSTTFTTGDVLGIAVDYSTLTWYGYKNGVLAGSQAITTSAVLPDFYYYGNDGTGASACINFGQQPWVYGPPSGFLALNSYNLPNSTILAGNKYMDATTYTANHSTQTITNAGGFKPDFVWEKSRTNAYSHQLFDSVRGVGKYLFSDQTSAEGTDATSLTSFNSNGYSVGATDNANLTNGTASVGWQWQAGQGTNTTNTNGSVTSTVSVNASAGFSVVTFSGNSTQITVGHGLGVAPKMIIVKDRTNAGSNWCVYHASTGAGGFLLLNATDAFTANTTMWNNTTPTSTVFNWAYGTSSTNYVAYCWAEIPGFSKIGSYTGNGSASPYGPFIYTGFRPKFILVKCATQLSGWQISDSSRSPYNVSAAALFPNSNNAEYTVASDVGIDFLSNGFKLRGQGGETNYYAGATYIYMAFAENPFKNALAR